MSKIKIKQIRSKIKRSDPDLDPESGIDVQIGIKPVIRNKFVFVCSP